MPEKLTEIEYWENYWRAFNLPAEITRQTSSLNILEELDIFDKFLPKGNFSVLEIGGAPGQYLSYFNKNHNYTVSCLDYSKVGCEKTLENFKLLNINGVVYEGDLFSENLDVPQFDIVCSFGFVEHFTNLESVVGKHLNYLKPGGKLIIGVPNLQGINHWFLKRLAPNLLLGHNLNTMDSKRWEDFENDFALKVIFKDYVGGFEPSVFLKIERKSVLNNSLFFLARILNRLFHSNMKILRKFNSKITSGYLMGIYQKPM